MNLDALELALRALPAVAAVGFTDDEGLLQVEVHAVAADDTLARRATRLAHEHAGMPVAVEVVRWGRGIEPAREARLQLLEVVADTAVGDLSVRIGLGDAVALGRGAMERGLLGAVEATVYAVRTFVPDLAYLPGWARVVETTVERQFLVVASVTDPSARRHLRGVADGATPVDGAVRATLGALNRAIGRELASPSRPRSGPAPAR